MLEVNKNNVLRDINKFFYNETFDNIVHYCNPNGRPQFTESCFK